MKERRRLSRAFMTAFIASSSCPFNDVIQFVPEPAQRDTSQPFYAVF